MTLEEAIQHCHEVAKENRKTALEYARAYAWGTAHECRECANEHEQLADWLAELKQLREDANKQPKTNGDYIRLMTDEKLADVLEWQCACCVYHPYQCKTECSEGHLKWLKKEVSANDER